MRARFVASAFLLTASAAHAVTVLDDDFSSYGPATVLNAADGVFGGVWETVDGTVDYLRTGFSDLCRDGAPCVDLDGSTRNAGIFRTVQAFGEGSYRLSFRLFGSGRGDTNAVTVSLGSFNQSRSISTAADWIVSDFIVTIGAGGSKLAFSNAGGDNIGAILNSVRLVKDGGDDMPPAIPVPAAAPLRLGGLGLMAALGWRRKRAG